MLPYFEKVKLEVTNILHVNLEKSTKCDVEYSKYGVPKVVTQRLCKILVMSAKKD